jgi:diguanylate cyclase (GGDEF)-like protein
MALLEKAQKDSLTTCYTKDLLQPFMEKMVAEYAAYKKPFSILVIDIDGFKGFNDRHGHIFGDEALKYFSSSLRLNLDDEDSVIIRFGGDEFVVIFPGRLSKEVYKLAVNTENNMRNRPFLFHGREYKISFSGGIASCPENGHNADEILDKADQAMYASKRRGNGLVTTYSKVWPKFFMWVLKIVVLLAAIVAAVFFVKNYKQENMPSFLKTSAPAKVYLKSGNSIQGVIVGENDKNMFLKFDMENGVGSVSIKKDDIKFVDRGYKK